MTDTARTLVVGLMQTPPYDPCLRVCVGYIPLEAYALLVSHTEEATKR